jgi:hypothetical protein
MREKMKLFGLLFACSFAYFFAYSFFGFDFTDMGYHLTCAQRVYAGDALAPTYYGSNWIAGLWLSLCPIEGKVMWCYWGGAILWGVTAGFIGLLIHELFPIARFAVVAVALSAVASFPLSQGDLIIQYYSLPMLLVVAYIFLFLSAAKAGSGIWRWALLSCLYVVLVWSRVTTLVYAVCPLLYLSWNCLFGSDKKRAFVQAAVWTAGTVAGVALLGYWYSRMTCLENPDLDTNRWVALSQSVQRVVSSLGLMLRALGAGFTLIFLLERRKYIYGKRVTILALVGVVLSLLAVGFVNAHGAAGAAPHVPRVLAFAAKGIQAAHG